jgi:VanZ family protein
VRGLCVVAGWAMVAAVVWLSLTPSPPEVEFEQSDKVGHFIAYGALMFWFSQLYAGRTRLLYGAGFVAMGVALEFAQHALGYRTLDRADMAANTLGVLLGWVAALILPRILPSAERNTG